MIVSAGRKRRSFDCVQDDSSKNAGSVPPAEAGSSFGCSAMASKLEGTCVFYRDGEVEI